jgi:hypothetical protein
MALHTQLESFISAVIPDRITAGATLAQSSHREADVDPRTLIAGGV